MTMTATRAPARYLDRERVHTAIHAAQAIILDQAPVARVALAYAMTPEALRELLADLAHDLTTAVEVRP